MLHYHTHVCTLKLARGKARTASAPLFLLAYAALSFTALLAYALQVYELQHAQSVAHAHSLGLRHPSDPPEPPPPTPTLAPATSAALSHSETPSGTAHASTAASRTNTPPTAATAQDGNVAATTSTDQPAIAQDDNVEATTTDQPSIAQDDNGEAVTSAGQPTAEAEPNPGQSAQDNVAAGPASATRTAAEKDEIHTPMAGAKRAREEESDAADPKRARTEAASVGTSATSQVTPWSLLPASTDVQSLLRFKYDVHLQC